jgi:hypothetical protein
MTNFLAIAVAALVLAGCGKRQVEPVVQFPVVDCKRDWLSNTREDRRQGGCILWTKIGDTRVCTSYHHYNVTQQAQLLTCVRAEWRDVE